MAQEAEAGAEAAANGLPGAHETTGATDHEGEEAIIVRLGIHVSIAGGMEKMARTAASLGCEAVQIFSRSPRGGKARPLGSDEVTAAKDILASEGIWPLVVHVPYYVNLASSDPVKHAYSVEVLADDLERAEIMGGKFVVTHIGRAEEGEESDSPQALERVLQSLDEVFTLYEGPVKLLLENTAGQKGEIGTSFETIASLLKRLPFERAGACFDTCHVFAAGYDLRGEDGVREVLSLFDDSIGLHRLGAIHLNDSKGALGSRIDRHEHIGLGQIGAEAFRALVNSAMLADDTPGLLETPVKKSGDDRQDMDAVKSMR